MEEFKNPAVDQAISGAQKLSTWIQVNKTTGGILGTELQIHRSVVQFVFLGEPFSHRADTITYAKFFARTGISEFDTRTLANFVEKPRRGSPPLERVRRWEAPQWESWLLQNGNKITLDAKVSLEYEELNKKSQISAQEHPATKAEETNSQSKDEGEAMSVRARREKDPWGLNLSLGIKRRAQELGLKRSFEISKILGINRSFWVHVAAGWYIRRDIELYARLFAFGIPEANPTTIPANRSRKPWTETELENWLWANVHKMKEAALEFEKYRKPRTNKAIPAQPDTKPSQLSEFRQWGLDRREDLRGWAISNNFRTINEIAKKLNLSTNIWHSLMQGVVLIPSNRWVYADLMLFTGLSSLDPSTIPDRKHAVPTNSKVFKSREAWTEDDWNRWLTTQPLEKQQRSEELRGKPATAAPVLKPPVRLNQFAEIVDEPSKPIEEPTTPGTIAGNWLAQFVDTTVEAIAQKAGRVSAEVVLALLEKKAQITTPSTATEIPKQDDLEETIGSLAKRLSANLQLAAEGTPRERDQIASLYFEEIRDLWLFIDPYTHDRASRERSIRFNRAGGN